MLAGVLFLYLRGKLSIPHFYSLSSARLSLDWILKAGVAPIPAVRIALEFWFVRWAVGCLAPLALWLFVFRKSRADKTVTFCKRVVVGICILVPMLLLTLRGLAFPNLELTVDEYAYRFLAHLLTDLRLAAPSFPHSEQLVGDGLIANAHGISAAWQPGWPLCLALATVFHAELWTNVGVFCLLEVSVFLLARKLGSARQAVGALLVLSLCFPLWMLALGGFPHLWVCVLSCHVWWSYLRYLDDGARGSAIAVMICLILLCLTRIQDGLCVLVVCLIWQRQSRAGFPFLLLGSVALSVCAALCANWLQTGCWFCFPTLLAYDVMAVGTSWAGRVSDLFYSSLVVVARLLWWTGPLFFLGERPIPETRLLAFRYGLLCQVVVYFGKFGLANVDWSARYYTQSLVMLCLWVGMTGFGSEKIAARQIWGLVLVFALGIQGIFLCQVESRRLMTIPALPGGLYFVASAAPGVSPRSLLRNGPDLQAPVFALWADPATNRAIRDRFANLPAFELLFREGRLQAVPLAPLVDSYEQTDLAPSSGP